MGEGVEWTAHSCILLAWMEDDAVPAAKLASYYKLPSAYLNKQLQSLVRAGILTSVPGPKGGFRLARPSDQITLWDIVAAIEGEKDAFHCTEIRAQAAGSRTQFSSPCSIAIAMHEAELAWRRALAQQTLASFVRAAERSVPDAAERARRWLDTAET
ncbi:MAG: RrF2 family transcriptional regulator [Candidatus Dormibacteraceae bacterium]